MIYRGSSTLREIISKIVLMLLLTNVLMFNPLISIVKAEWFTGPVYIKNDGRIIPSNAPIITYDKITYTLTNNIYNGLIIERDNITINGENHIIQGQGTKDSVGINIRGRYNVTIINTIIKGFFFGILIDHSSNIIVSKNKILNNENGIRVGWASGNFICGNDIVANEDNGILLFPYSNNNIIHANNIENCGHGIHLEAFSNNNIITANNIKSNKCSGILFLNVSSENNIISGNNIVNNFFGVSFQSKSSSNKFYHNMFINSVKQHVVFDFDTVNIWDDDYPSGGNYWSDYTGIDTNGDGIGDTPYIIDGNNLDRYPKMNPWEHIIVSIYPPIPGLMFTGQSITFTSTISGGHPPYTYQWYLNDAPISGATSTTWTFTPAAAGTYIVYLRVRDNKGYSSLSEFVKITVKTKVQITFFTIDEAGNAIRGTVLVFAGLSVSHGDSITIISGSHTLSIVKITIGYMFERWDASGSIDINSPTSISTTATISGPGSIIVRLQRIPTIDYAQLYTTLILIGIFSTEVLILIISKKIIKNR